MAEPATSPKKQCFVVGPIGKPESDVRVHADWFFEEIVEAVFWRESLKDFKAIRADKISIPGMIDAQVIGHLLDADLVIADLSGTNPNAFYEIGIRHMVEKPIIHMHLEGDEIPFDVSLYRAIPFSRRTPADIRKARSDLAEAILAVMAPNYTPDNPVIRARGRMNVRQSASPEMQVLFDEVTAIRTRLSGLEFQTGLSQTFPGTSVSGVEIQIFHSATSVFEIGDLSKRISALMWSFVSSGAQWKVSDPSDGVIVISFGERVSQDVLDVVVKAIARFEKVREVQIKLK